MTSNQYDAIIIGGGHNGLVAAAYLAKAGKKALVLERRHIVGGAAVTEDIFPGYKFNGQTSVPRSKVTTLARAARTLVGESWVQRGCWRQKRF